MSAWSNLSNINMRKNKAKYKITYAILTHNL